MFDRTKLTTEQMTILNRTYVLIRVHGINIWSQRFKVLTGLPQELKDEIDAEERK
jgi:hypothetical protein